IILALPAGHVADRYSRRRVLMWAQLVFTVSSIGLAAVSLEHGPIALLYVLLFCGGIARTFQGAAKGSLLPQIVEPTQFANAVTWNSAGWQMASVIGPALGGLLIGLTHRAWPVYLAAALTALAFLALLLGIR